MKIVKSLLLGLLVAAPLSLSAATEDVFLVMGSKVEKSGDRTILTGDVRVVRKDAAGVSTGVKAERVVVEDDLIRCVGNVTVTLGAEILQVREIAFATRGAQVAILNRDGLTLQPSERANPVFKGVPGTEAKPATDFNQSFPKTDSRLPTNPRTWKVERMEDFKVVPVPQTLQSPRR